MVFLSQNFFLTINLFIHIIQQSSNDAKPEEVRDAAEVRHLICESELFHPREIEAKVRGERLECSAQSNQKEKQGREGQED